MEKVVISIENVKKKYRLGTIGGGTLTGDLQSWWAKKTGTIDPNSKIGQEIKAENKEFWALKGVSAEIYEGEAIGIIGTNGAGKSTLLKIMSRVTAPTEGIIKYKGRLTSMLEVGTGFHGELTGRENIYLNGSILGMNKKEIDSKIEDIINFSEVGEFIDTPVKRYSSGMYVKLAFSVAAHLNSEIMIMDEVLAVGDAAFQKKCLDRMKMLATNEKRTILYVSHNMSTIRKLCTRCIVLDHGEIAYIGEVEEAIKIYMSMSNALKVSDNLDNFKRQHKHLTSKVIFKRVNIIGKNVLEMGDKLNIEVEIECMHEIECMAFRIVIHSSEGSVLGMTMSREVSIPMKGERKIYNVVVDESILAPGEYLLDIVACSPNGFGSNEVYDIVGGVVTWTVLASNGQNHGIEWSTIHWGYNAFPILQIID